MDDLKVTVYISTCNRIDKLKRAVNSVLAQTYKNIELIISDDASTDGTEDYASRLAIELDNVKYFRNKENKGACFTRNVAIENATGDFITGLDDDDEFEDFRVEYFLKSWDSKYSFICSDFFDVYNNCKRVKHYRKLNDYIGEVDDLCLENLASNQIFTLTSRLQSIGGFEVNVKKLQDWDTWIKLVHKYGPFKRLKEATYLMHHDHQLNESRVSTSYPLDLALEELLERNFDIYTIKNRRIMNFIISCEKGNSSFLEAIKVMGISKNLKYLLKYFRFKFKRGLHV